MTGHFATLHFERQVAAPVETLWQAWTAPAARAVWAAPTAEVTVEILSSETGPGGREVSLCRRAGQPDFRCDTGWMEWLPPRRSVNHELVTRDGRALSSALVTADFTAQGTGSLLAVTVQLSAEATSDAPDMEEGYRQGFAAGLDNLADVAARTMVLHRRINAPRAKVWGAWVNPETLPQWWGPDGFSCRTDRIDLRTGGEWLFDMIGPDGTVFPNHHLYHEIRAEDRIRYGLLAGENGPKHADAWVCFDDVAGGTDVTLGMVFSSLAEYQTAKGFGAEALGLQTLGKLAHFIDAP